MEKMRCAAQFAMHLLAFACVGMFSTGFTFVANPPAKLPATPENPTVTFIWDGRVPPLDEKDSFRAGVFADQSDEQVMEALITEAMATWSNVRGSYLRLNLSTDTETPEPSKEDHNNFIVVAATQNLNSAAFATPSIERPDERHSEIADCDITVGTKKVTIEFLLYALTHELGHCIGLGHAHDNYKSLMGYSRTPGSAKLSADDKAGITYLYGDPAYGDQRVRRIIGKQCGTLGALSGDLPDRKVAWLVLASPLLLLAYRYRLQS